MQKSATERAFLIDKIVDELDLIYKMIDNFD